MVLNYSKILLKSVGLILIVHIILVPFFFIFLDSGLAYIGLILFRFVAILYISVYIRRKYTRCLEENYDRRKKCRNILMVVLVFYFMLLLENFPQKIIGTIMATMGIYNIEKSLLIIVVFFEQIVNIYFVMNILLSWLIIFWCGNKIR